MELAQALVQLWQRKIWVAIGIAVAVIAAFGSREALKSKVYSAAATQMVVDSPQSALGNIAPNLAPFIARAGIFARLMTSPQALDAIGRASGIPGSEIAAQGPPEVGLPAAGAQPTAVASPTYKLLLNQDPSLPTIDVYSQAPTTQQAIALANGAVTGFAAYLKTLEDQASVRPSDRVDIRQLGSATGGVVDSGAGTKIAAIIAVMVLLIWCGAILFISRTRASWASRNIAPLAPMDAAPVAPSTPLRPVEAADDTGWSPFPGPLRDAESPTGGPIDDAGSEPVPDRLLAKSPFLRHEP